MKDKKLFKINNKNAIKNVDGSEYSIWKSFPGSTGISLKGNCHQTKAIWSHLKKGFHS